MIIRSLIIFGLCLAVGSTAFADSKGDRLGKLDCTIDQIAKFDGEKWVCADPPSGGGDSFQVFDSSEPPRQIGTLIDSFDSNQRDFLLVRVLFEVQGEIVFLDLTWDGFLRGPTIMYDSDDCTGNTFAFAAFPDGPVPNNLFGSNVHGLIGRNGGVGDSTLYLTDGDSFIDSSTGYSFVQTGGECEFGTSGGGVFTPVMAVLNLSLEFLPPFQIMRAGPN